jgi:hypothetical protein
MSEDLCRSAGAAKHQTQRCSRRQTSTLGCDGNSALDLALTHRIQGRNRSWQCWMKAVGRVLQEGG